METIKNTNYKYYIFKTTAIVWNMHPSGNVTLTLHKPTTKAWPVVIRQRGYKPERRAAAEKAYRKTMAWIDRNAS